MNKVSVSVNAAGIQELFSPGGGVYNTARRIGTVASAGVRGWATAHTRTGRLAKSISSQGSVGRYSVRWTVSSNAEHAPYLERGTRPRVAKVMYADVLAGRLPITAASHYTAWIGMRNVPVRGTPAFHFMENALTRALRTAGF